MSFFGTLDFKTLVVAWSLPQIILASTAASTTRLVLSSFLYFISFFFSCIFVRFLFVFSVSPRNTFFLSLFYYSIVLFFTLFRFCFDFRSIFFPPFFSIFSIFSIFFFFLSIFSSDFFLFFVGPCFLYVGGVDKRLVHSARTFVH